MRKTRKITLIILSIVVFLLIGCYLFVAAFWNGTSNLKHPKEIATYHSPNADYSLVFEQMGDPAWPFGSTDVRLTLKNQDDKIIERISAQLYDDGANASEHNIVSISWNDNEVVVVLSASEMENKEVSIKYK